MEFGDCRGSQPLAAMTKWLAGVAVSSLAVFYHGINGPTGARLETAPNFLAIHIPASRSMKVGRFLFAGSSQSRVEQECLKLHGASLQALQGSESSVGRRVLLHRCATGAAWIGCPRTLLTSRCVRAWQDRSRDCLRASPRSRALCSPTIRAARADVRLIGVSGRSE